MKDIRMEDMLNELSIKMFGRDRSGNQCVTCGSTQISYDDFQDDLSRREFDISKMCQKCQDETFCEDDEETE